MDDALQINSFIILFVHSEHPGGSFMDRGSIRHIQTNHERNFTHWEEAVAFIQTYVPLDKEDPSGLDRLSSPHL